jgi:hypothetical protein
VKETASDRNRLPFSPASHQLEFAKLVASSSAPIYLEAAPRSGRAVAVVTALRQGTRRRVVILTPSAFLSDWQFVCERFNQRPRVRAATTTPDLR